MIFNNILCVLLTIVYIMQLFMCEKEVQKVDPNNSQTSWSSAYNFILLNFPHSQKE